MHNPEFLRYLDLHQYRVNKDKVKFGKLKNVLQLVVTGLGAFGLLVVLLALMLFSFYLQLLIARVKTISLLLTLGYSPAWLTKTVAGRWVPIYIVVVISALVLTSILQWGFYSLTTSLEVKISPFIHWSVLLLAVVLIILTAYSNYRLYEDNCIHCDSRCRIPDTIYQYLIPNSDRT
jgi:hypothetical protein